MLKLSIKHPTTQATETYAANRLNENCAKKIIELYGFDRVNWVLAHTIQRGDNDTRFSNESHSWAKG